MDDLLLLGVTDEGTQLFVSELSSTTLHENGITDSLERLYLYEADTSAAGYGIRVLASVASVESAYRMLELFRSHPKTNSRRVGVLS